MKNKKCKLLLVLAASSLFALTSCGEKPQDTTTSEDTNTSSEVVKTYYSITLTAGDNYKIEADFGYDASKVEEGKNFKFKVTPNEGYDVISVKAGSATLTPKNGVYTIENVKANVTVTVEVAIQTLKVTFEGEHFTATPKEGFTPDNVNFGGSYEFTLTIDEHYHLVAVKVGENVLTATEGVYKITEIKANTVVKVETEIDSFAVTFEGEHATATVLEGYDATKVNYGAELKFKVEADAHYNVASVKDGETVLTATDGVYTLTNVTKATTIKIEVELDSHKVTFVGEGFTVTDVEGFNKESITHGNEYKFKLTVKEHFHVASVKIGETSLTADTSGIYTISNIVEDKTVTIVTEEDTYKLTIATGENYTVELEEAGLDLNTVTYSKEVKFKVSAAKYYSITAVKLNGEALTIGEDGYYLVKNQVSDSTIAIEATRNKATVTFNTTGGTAIAAKTIDQGTKVEEVIPTRAADEYYDAYTFDGWYLNGEKFNFETIIESDITLVAKWKYGNSKTTYLNNWAKGDFGVENGASIVTIDSAFSNICWRLNGASGVNQELKTQYMAEFGKTDNDGWMLNFNNFETTDKTTGVKTVNRGVISLPKTNFHELLAGGKVATMEVGGGGAWNNIWLAAGGADTRISDNRGNPEVVESLTRTTITIYEDSEGKVRLNYFDRLIAEPRSNNAEYPYGEIVLTDEEANGTASLKLHSSQDGAGRRYWLSKLTVTSGERVYKDFSTKTGFTVDNGTAYTQAESASTGGAPHGQWASIMSPYNLAVGVYGTNKSGPTTLNLDPINFNELFENGEGVRFTLGTWNGTDKISFMNGEETAELGGAEVKPNNHASGNYHDPLKYTWSLIENTWRNWKVSIDRFGMNVHNSYANEDYHFALTEGQLNGTESLTFKLGTYSNDHFFVLTNMMTYHI